MRSAGKVGLMRSNSSFRRSTSRLKTRVDDNKASLASTCISCPLSWQNTTTASTDLSQIPRTIMPVSTTDTTISNDVASLYLELLNKVHVDVALPQRRNAQHLGICLGNKLKAPDSLKHLLGLRIVDHLCCKLKEITLSSASDFTAKVRRRPPLDTSYNSTDI